MIGNSPAGAGHQLPEIEESGATDPENWNDGPTVTNTNTWDPSDSDVSPKQVYKTDGISRLNYTGTETDLWEDLKEGKISWSTFIVNTGGGQGSQAIEILPKSIEDNGTTEPTAETQSPGRSANPLKNVDSGAESSQPEPPSITATEPPEPTESTEPTDQPEINRPNTMIDSIRNPDEQLRRLSGQDPNSTTTGSGILASGGDPLSASITSDPGSTSVDLESSVRILRDSMQTGDAGQIAGNVNTVLGDSTDTASRTVTDIAETIRDNQTNDSGPMLAVIAAIGALAYIFTRD